MTDGKKSQEELVKEEKDKAPKDSVKEINGRGGLEPTRYDDWEIKGKCVDF